MSFLNELEGWVQNWFEDPANDGDLDSVVNAATIIMVIDQLRVAEEAKK